MMKEVKMNEVSVKGGTKYQREITEKIVHMMIKELMPKMRTLDIEVQLVKMGGDEVGFCMMGDHNRHYEIEVDSKQGLNDFVTTICHEMVHLKQYARNEMNGEDWRWKKSRVAKNTPYMDLPWEKEAYKLQDELALKVWQSHIL